MGLSPRTRGRRQHDGVVGQAKGSIPANAGETRRERPVSRARGLSPRTRGRPDERLRHNAVTRSIPANAGETASAGGAPRAAWVYPRERGGDPPCAATWRSPSGLSPRTRGRRRDRHRQHRRPGSIPANAGETSPRSVSLPYRGVYPRERGGDGATVTDSTDVPGLSPRTRGRRRPMRSGLPPVRSIPANAGETSVPLFRPVPPRVYPRERGGDSAVAELLRRLSGLSPRTRGRHSG